MLSEPKSKVRQATSDRCLKALETGDVAIIYAALSPRQQMFVEEYTKDYNASRAAERAGYQGKNVGIVGHQLTQNRAIQFLIENHKTKRPGYSDVTKDYVLRKIMKTIENAEKDGQHQAVLRGAELLARHLGMFIERTEISGPDGEAIKYEKTIEDAADFTSSIAKLAKRSGT